MRGCRWYGGGASTQRESASCGGNQTRYCLEQQVVVSTAVHECELLLQTSTDNITYNDIPNSQITSNVITNFSAQETRRVDLTFGIGYGDDLLKAKNILNDLVNADERILKDPAPFIAVSELADSSVNFVVRAWTKTGDYWSVYFDMTEKVKLTFDKEGISIPFPQRDVHIYNHN